MALFKIFKGNSSNLPKTYKDGYCYFTVNDGKMYIDTKDSDSTGRICLNASHADSATKDSDNNIINSTYLKKTGGAMTGKLYAHGGISLNDTTSAATLQYLVGLTPFASGGDMVWSATDNVTVGKSKVLNTARTINGTSFDGSSNITTANWGTARDITIGHKKQSINGSSNITYLLTDIITNSTIIKGSTDFNTLTDIGGYISHGGDGFVTESNGPITAYPYGGLYVLKTAENNSGVHYPIHQFYIPHNTSSTGIWYRSGWGGTYNENWNLLLDNNNYTKYTVTKTGSGASGTWGINITGNAATAAKLQTARTIQTNLASTTSVSFDGSANITPGVTGILPIANGGTGANNRKTAITNLAIFGLYDRNDIGTAPNFDNPGVNGLFEIRHSSETPNETGTKPFDSFAPFISLRYSNTMFQLTGVNSTGFYIRGKQAGDPTLTGVAWQKILTDSNYTSYTVKKDGTGASGTWGISITGNAATATKATQDGSGNVITSKYVTLDTTQTISGAKTFTGKMILQNSGDSDVATANSGILLIGTPTGEHISIDGNEIMAKATGTTAGTLNLQVNNGGPTLIGSNLTVGGTTSLNNSLTVTGISTFKNAIQIGNSATGDNNYIAFYGISGDNPGSYNHTYIGENHYGADLSELVLFKGNDPGASIAHSTASGAVGPDRIRHIAGAHLFQVYSSALSGTFPVVCDSTVPVNKFEVNQSGAKVHGDLTVIGASTFTGNLRINNNKQLYVNKTISADYTSSSPTEQPIVIDCVLAEGVSLTDKNAPGIGFHVNGTTWGSLALTSQGFKFLNNARSGLMNVYANSFVGSLSGNASTATTATQAHMLSNFGNTTVAISQSVWQHNPWGITNPKYVWGQAFKDTTVSNDSGNIAILCGANSTAGGYGAHFYVDGGLATLGSIYGSKVYGAVWNDYAEYRSCKEDFKPGQVVIENGDDTLSVSNSRLQRGCSIVSDTFGFAIGETDEAKCPIAVSGRVLAYGYESREEFKKHIGWPVCSGPNGTVSIMTEEEEEKYPSRIIGIISAVPDYEEWGTENIKVDNRIWIKVK